MDDDELDSQLDYLGNGTTHVGMRSALLQVSHAARASLMEENKTMLGRSTSRSPRRRVVLAGAFAAAALVLTAGTTATAYYLHVAPFQDLPHGSTRTSESIPLDYQRTNGVQVRCRIFIEFQRVDSSGMSDMNAAIRTHDWTGFGQRLYDAHPDLPSMSKDDQKSQVQMSDPEVDATYRFAAGVIPGLKLMSAGTTQPTLSAVAVTCRPDA